MKNRKQNFDLAQTACLKQLIFIAFIFSVIFSCTDSNAQTFTKAITYKAQQRDMIAFTVSREANVRYYNIEAANDTINFELIAKVKSRGNTVIPREYNYEITGSNYKYYRISGVYMNWQSEHSPIIISGENYKNTPQSEHIPATSQIAVVKNIH